MEMEMAQIIMAKCLPQIFSLFSCDHKRSSKLKLKGFRDAQLVHTLVTLVD